MIIVYAVNFLILLIYISSCLFEIEIRYEALVWIWENILKIGARAQIGTVRKVKLIFNRIFKACCRVAIHVVETEVSDMYLLIALDACVSEIKGDFKGGRFTTLIA